MSMTARLRSIPANELDALRAQDDVPTEFYDDPELDVDQAWDVLTHVLRTSGSRAAAAAILGGAPFGEDQGYGPPRTFTADDVALVAGELARIDDDAFRRHYAATDLSEAYGSDGYDVEEALESFRELRDCYESAAARGHAMALFM
jgi:hypothetical protein